MSETKYLLYSLISLSIVTLAFFIHVKHFNMNVSLNDDIWMGIAFFINYLLLCILYKPKYSDISMYKFLPKN
jgi:uncharacterized membrane protein